MTFKKIEHDKPFDISDLQKLREQTAEFSEKHRPDAEKLRRAASQRRQKQSTAKPNPFKTGEKPISKPTSGVVIEYDPTTDKYKLLTDEGEIQGEPLTNGPVKIGQTVPIYRDNGRIFFKVPPINKKKSASPNRRKENPYIGKGSPDDDPPKKKVKIRIGVTAVFLRWDGDGANLPPRPVDPPDPPPDDGGGGGGGGSGSGGSSG